MSPFVLILFFAVFPAVMAVVSLVLKKNRAGSGKHQMILENFRQNVSDMLQQGEVLEGICGYSPCAAVTNQRLLVSTKQGIDSVQFYEIKSLRGTNATGSKTYDPDRMLVFEIKAGKKYVLGNHSEGFNDVVSALFRYVGR